MVACVADLHPSIAITAVDVDHTGKSVITDLSWERSPESLRGINRYVVKVGVGEIEIRVERVIVTDRERLPGADE
jgi:hypothetical protein